MGDGMADAKPAESCIKAGKHPEKALSAAFVRTIAKAGKYNDGNGLFLKVDLTGSRRWVQRIVIRGKRTEIGLGSAWLVTLAEERSIAADNRRMARVGGDPLNAKREAEAVLAFGEAARKVRATHAPSWRDAKHAAQFFSTLETYSFSRIGRHKVADITSADVLALLQPIWLEKPETERRVRQRTGTVMKGPNANGWRQGNPADVVTSALPNQSRVPQHRKSLPYGEVSGCLSKIKSSGANSATKLALEFSMLTACRSGEVRQADWSEINLDRREWTIPPDRMKAKRLHRVPLSLRAKDFARRDVTWRCHRLCLSRHPLRQAVARYDAV